MYWDGVTWRPYLSIAEANATIYPGVRVVGLLVRIASGWYEYRNGIEDYDLVPFVAGTGLAQLSIKVDGEPGSPIVGAYTFTSGALVGAYVEMIYVNKMPETSIDGDFTLDNSLGKITRVNPWLDGDTCLITYRVQ